MPLVRYAELRPHEFRQRLAARPLAYLPLGTLEWHGEHLPLGSDAIQAEALMVACAERHGGIVLPPIHLGPDRAALQDDGTTLVGMDYADTTTPHRQLDGSCYWASPGFFAQLVDAILAQVKRAGFKAVFADGHGPSRWAWVAGMAERESRFGLKLFGLTDDLRPRWQYMVDHAAKNETSIMMHCRGDRVDLSQLPADCSVWPQGVGGADPRDASAEHGRQCIEDAAAVLGRLFDEAGV